MYSGITRGLFTVTQVEKKPGLIRFAVKLSNELLQGLEIGASVSVDGVCQTVVAIEGDEVFFEAMSETLNLTTLSDLFIERKVSIENSLRYGDVIGGHEIAGHIIGTANVIDVLAEENNLALTLQCPKKWFRYIFSKGYIAVDGSSLTVGKINSDENSFTIHLIPETLRLTNFGNKKLNDKVNIEIDFKTQAIVDTVERVLKENYCTRT